MTDRMIKVAEKLEKLPQYLIRASCYQHLDYHTKDMRDIEDTTEELIRLVMNLYTKIR